MVLVCKYCGFYELLFAYWFGLELFLCKAVSLTLFVLLCSGLLFYFG